MLPQMGFEPGTSHLLHTKVTERFRVRIPVGLRVFFHVRKFAIFSYCASPGWCERQALLLSRHQWNPRGQFYRNAGSLHLRPSWRLCLKSSTNTEFEKALKKSNTNNKKQLCSKIVKTHFIVVKYILLYVKYISLYVKYISLYVKYISLYVKYI